MTKKRVVDFLLALTGGAIALVGYFYIEDWYYWVVALGGGKRREHLVHRLAVL